MRRHLIFIIACVLLIPFYAFAQEDGWSFPTDIDPDLQAQLTETAITFPQGFSINFIEDWHAEQFENNLAIADSVETFSLNAYDLTADQFVLIIYPSAEFLGDYPQAVSLDETEPSTIVSYFTTMANASGQVQNSPMTLDAIEDDNIAAAYFQSVFDHLILTVDYGDDFATFFFYTALNALPDYEPLIAAMVTSITINDEWANNAANRCNNDVPPTDILSVEDPTDALTETFTDPRMGLSFAFPTGWTVCVENVNNSHVLAPDASLFDRLDFQFEGDESSMFILTERSNTTFFTGDAEATINTMYTAGTTFYTNDAIIQTDINGRTAFYYLGYAQDGSHDRLVITLDMENGKVIALMIVSAPDRIEDFLPFYLAQAATFTYQD